MAKADLTTKTKLRDSAASFLRMVRKKFDLELDYSEESVLVADDLISLFFKIRKSHYFTVARVIGSYLGEVIIANMGGRWSRDITLEKVGAVKGVAQPMLRARRRLANGMQDSLAYYYRSLKLSNMHDTSFASGKEKIDAMYASLRKGGWDRELLNRVLDESEKKYVREEAADILGRVGDPDAVPRLVEALKDSRTAYYAAIALQGLPDERAYDALHHLVVKTRSPALKMQAALALGAVGNAAAVPALVSLLNDDNEIVCHYASMALGKTGGDAAVTAVLDQMASLPREKLVFAIFALEELGDGRSVPALIECVFSRDDEIREAALRALQNIPDERAFKPLVFLLKDRSYRIRTLAGYALANFEDSRVIPHIKALMKDEVQAVRHHASKLLHWLEEGKRPPRCI